MNVLLLTIFLSICLAAMFMVLFLRDRSERKGSSMEHDALLPLEEERTRPAKPNTRSSKI